MMVGIGEVGLFLLDRGRPSLALAAVLIAIAYGPSLARLIAITPLSTPGLRVW